MSAHVAIGRRQPQWRSSSWGTAGCALPGARRGHRVAWRAPARPRPTTGLSIAPRGTCGGRTHELTNVVVREAVNSQARRWRLFIEEIGLVGHQPGRDPLMGDLEVDTESSQACVEALTCRSASVISKRAGSRATSKAISHGQPGSILMNSVSETVGRRWHPECPSSCRWRTRAVACGNPAGLAMLVEAAERLGPPELGPHDLGADTRLRTSKPFLTSS